MAAAATRRACARSPARGRPARALIASIASPSRRGWRSSLRTAPTAAASKLINRLACAPGTPAAGKSGYICVSGRRLHERRRRHRLHACLARRPGPARRRRRPARLRHRFFQRRGDDAAARLRGRRDVRRDRSGRGREPVRARRLRARGARRRARHPRHARQMLALRGRRGRLHRVGTLRVGRRDARRLGGAQRLRRRRLRTTLPPRPGIDDGTSVVRFDYASCGARRRARAPARWSATATTGPTGNAYASSRLLGGVMSRQLDTGEAIVDFFAAHGRP